MEAFCCEEPDLGRFWLIDTPGWSDTHLDDAEVLETLAAWLYKAYNQHIELTGILYLHSIRENRVADSIAASFEWFRQLCGDHAFRKVHFITSFWDDYPYHLAESRERQLKSSVYWGSMIQREAGVSRHDNTPASAHEIVRKLLQRQTVDDRGTYLDIQREMATGNRLSETTVGQNINSYNARQRQYFTSEMERIERNLQDRMQDLTEQTRLNMQAQRNRYQAELGRLRQDHVRLQANIHTLDERIRRLQLEKEDEAKLAEENEIALQLRQDVRELGQRQQEIAENEEIRSRLEHNRRRAEQIRHNYECAPQ